MEPEQLNDNVFICSSHFTIDCSVNYSKHAAGFLKHIMLLKDTAAVPSILSSDAQVNAFIF